jgi:(p)ppGpp synthase/HD superfamily hydrolase
MRKRDRRKLEAAMDFALRAHGPQPRGGTAVPYASHLLQVAGLVLENGGDLEQAMAAFLHDTLEDCPEVTPGKLRRRFGKRVAAIVADCTDTLPGGGPRDASTWTERKRRYLEHLASAPGDSVLVSACDKLQNLGSIVADVRAQGTPYLERFNAGPEQQLGYYRGILEATRERVPARLTIALERGIGDLEALIG